MKPLLDTLSARTRYPRNEREPRKAVEQPRKLRLCHRAGDENLESGSKNGVRRSSEISALTEGGTEDSRRPADKVPKKTVGSVELTAELKEGSRAHRN